MLYLHRSKMISNSILFCVLFLVCDGSNSNCTNAKLAKDVETLKELVLKLNNENVQTRNIVQNLQSKLDDALSELEIREKCCSKNSSEYFHQESLQRRQLTTTTTTAFYAYMTKQERSPGPHHTLIFDHAVTNLGRNYNPYTGIFIAPKSGHYVFSYSITPDTDGHIPVELIKNAAVVGSSYNIAYSSYTSPASSTVIVELNAGDVCYLRTSATASPSGNINSGAVSRSSFTGWLL